MTYPNNTKPEPTLPFDGDPIETSLPFNYNDLINKKEDNPMTAKEFVTHLFEHCDEFPTKMTVQKASELMENILPQYTPADLTPELFASVWNELVETTPREIMNLQPDH